ncbi:hypothetical protein LEN26_018799 [Aphanomyces euteiches]|nr:hypothetical protein LEN26_018799 [Aphanomyces euteiches]KAH9123039.1 hypothetical protein AeMF1_005879 [Aphanomyces euteiches]KAH9190016.1 hypothetical protein AeNC1_008006 [Aphanomyces euteiches]
MLPADVLSEREKEHFTNIAKHMTQALLAATNVSQAMPWKLVYDKQFSIYRTELCGLGPCNVHAVTKLVAHIEEVTEALITTTTEAYKTMMTTLSSDFVDGAVLANILTPTPETPFRYVGLKWAAFKSSTMSIRSKDKDFIILEYVDLVEDARGNKTAFRIMQSVDVPDSLDTAATQGRYTREQVPLVGFLYYTTPKKGELRMTYTCNVDTKGELPTWAANTAIQSHVEKCITRTLKYIEFQRVRSDSFELPQRVIPMSGETGSCHVCDKKFNFYRHRYSCLKCAKYVCSNCYSLRTAAVPDHGERRCRVCTACVIQVRQARRGSGDIKKEHLDTTVQLHERQSLHDLLNCVRDLVANDYKLFSSHPPHSFHHLPPSHGPPPAAALARRRVTVGPQELKPSLDMLKEGQAVRSVPAQRAAIPDKRRSTVGPTDLQSSLAKFHQVYNVALSVASHREDDETSEDGSMGMISSDSEAEDDSDPGQFVPLTEHALRKLDMWKEKSKSLEQQSEEINKLANCLARQLSDSHSALSRKSSAQSVHSRKASSSTIVLYDMDQGQPQHRRDDNEQLRAFLQSKGAKRRSSGSEVAKSYQHPSSLFMF